MVDANKSGENVAADSSSDSALTIVRFGRGAVACALMS